MNKSTTAIALIPARGGSKRITKKNIKLFHGKPIIAYSIEAAFASGCFDRVIVSTDCEEIAAIARAYGADIPFVRPAELSDDHATTLDVINHALAWIEAEGINLDTLCCIYATAPFVTGKSIREGYEVLCNTQHNYAFTVAPYSFPIQRALKRNHVGVAEMFNTENYTKRSQDLEPAYHDAGQFYWGRREAFNRHKPLYDDDAYMIILPPYCVQDIDTLSDWQRAEALFSLLNPQREGIGE